MFVFERWVFKKMNIESRCHLRFPNIVRLSNRALLLTTTLCWFSGVAQAQDATWLANPGSNVLDISGNWNTGSLPSSTGTGFFGASSQTDLILANEILEVGAFSFSNGSPDYVITVPRVPMPFGPESALRFLGAGLVTNGVNVTIQNEDNLHFRNASKAGGTTIVNKYYTEFSDDSSAENALIQNRVGEFTFNMYFIENSSAGNATIENGDPSFNFAPGQGSLSFFGNARAGAATIKNENSGVTFWENSTADNATIINNKDGYITFIGNSTAGNATIFNNAGASLSFGFDRPDVPHSPFDARAPNTIDAGNARIIQNSEIPVDFSVTFGALGDFRVSAGSIDGTGGYTLGKNQFTVGANGDSTEVSGMISSLGGEFAETGGSLVKVGTGTLTLSGTNTYDGGTTVNGGTLQLGNGGTTGSVLGNVLNNARFGFDYSSDMTFDGAISGTGSVFKDGGGTLTLTNTHTHAGGTMVSDGELRVNGVLGGAADVSSGAALGGSGTVGGIATIASGGTISPGAGGVGTLNVGSLDLSNGSILDFELGTATTPAGGAGNDLINVAGDLTLDGRLDITDIGGFGAGVYRLINYGGSLIDNGLDLGAMPAGVMPENLNVQTSVASQINLISSFGLNLGFWDGSNILLHNDNKVDGGSGTWIANDRAWTQASGAINGPYQPNPTFAVFQGNAGTVTVDDSAGDISVTGMQFVIDGYNITGDSVTLANAGSAIRVGDGSAQSAGITAVISSDLIGGGGLNKTDLGTLVLAGDNRFTGGTTVSGGTLQLGAAERLLNSGSVAIASGATFDLNGFDETIGALSGAGNVTLGAGSLTTGDSTNTLFSGIASGSGGLVKMGSGTLTLTGENTYTGDTTISAGRLQIGDGGITGNLAGEVTNNAQMAFNRTDDLDFGGVISGTGSLIKDGAGNLTLSAANSFSGNTNVNSGFLTVNGSILGGAFVNNGATLGGTGTIGNATIRSGGTLTVGGAGIGTLNANGDLVFEVGSVFRARIDARANSDQVIATGTTTISNNGTILDVFGLPGDYPITDTYTVLTSAGGVTGEFSAVQDNLPDIDLEAIYTGNEVRLTYIKAAALEGTPKQIFPSALAAGLDVANGFTQTLRRRGGLYNRADGTRIGSAAGFNFGNAGRQTPETGAGLAQSATEPNSGIWGAAFGDTSKTNSSGSTPGWDSESGGLIGGFEHRFSGRPATIGIAVGYSQTNVTSGSSKSDIENVHVGAYGAMAKGALSVSGAVSYTHQSYDFSRLVDLGVGGSATARSDATGYTVAASGEVFYNIAGSGDGAELVSGRTIRFGPLATMDAAYGVRDSLTETDAGILNLALGKDDAQQMTTGLGMAIGMTHSVGTLRVNVDTRVAWEHVFGDAAVSSTASIPLANATFVTNSAGIDRNRIAIGFGTALHFSDTISTHLRYDGAFSQSSQDHQGSAGLSIKF